MLERTVASHYCLNLRGEEKWLSAMAHTVFHMCGTIRRAVWPGVEITKGETVLQLCEEVVSPIHSNH